MIFALAVTGIIVMLIVGGKSILQAAAGKEPWIDPRAGFLFMLGGLGNLVVLAVQLAA